MYIAHSKITPPEEEPKPERVKARGSDFGERYSQQLYAKACEKLMDRIKAIQVHKPGWMPANPNK